MTTTDPTAQNSYTAELAERTVVVTWPDNERGGATPPPDGWQERAWEQESTLYEIDESSVCGCSVLRWRDDPRSDGELLAASLALIGQPPAVPVSSPPADRAAVEAERDSLGREADRLRKDWVEMRTRAERAEATALLRAADIAEDVAESLRKHHEFERSTGALDVMTELRRVAAEEQPTEPWLTDSARIGRALIWSWSDVGKGAFREGYRAAQAEARALLGGERGTEQQRPAVGEQPDTQEAP